MPIITLFHGFVADVQQMIYNYFGKMQDLKDYLLSTYAALI